MKKEKGLIPLEIIERKIYLIRGVKVMLDSDLAFLYQVPTKVLNQAVRRNIKRFPVDFMFQLSKKESDLIQEARSQIVTLKPGKNIKYSPYAFTEQGVAMLSSVLKSDRAIQVNIAIIRAFIKLREMLSTHKNLITEFEKMKRVQKEHGENISLIMDVINRLLAPPSEPEKELIGFRDRGKKK